MPILISFEHLFARLGPFQELAVIAMGLISIHMITDLPPDSMLIEAVLSPARFWWLFALIQTLFRLIIESRSISYNNPLVPRLLPSSTLAIFFISLSLINFAAIACSFTEHGYATAGQLLGDQFLRDLIFLFGAIGFLIAFADLRRMSPYLPSRPQHKE